MTPANDIDTDPAWPIARLQLHAVAPTARLLADAFHDNPCYVFMHPRAARRSGDLLAFFERDLRWRQSLGLSFVARDRRGAVVATGSLEPPGGGVPKALGKVAAHWILPTLRGQGARTLVRCIAAERAFARQRRLAAGQLDYWHLHAVAVRPDLQGRAIGSAIVRRLLAELRLRDPAALLPVVLATQREETARFYHRFGFRVRHRALLCPTLRAAGFPSWFMRFEPLVPPAAE